MKIEIIFIAHNRLTYTKAAMSSLLADFTEDFAVTIWDNGSTDGTRDYLDSLKDPRIAKKVFSDENLYLTGAANKCFEISTADLVGIVPDDFLLTPGWTKPLARAHADVPEFGFIGCWHLGKNVFDERRARHKIQQIGEHRILRHPFTGGGAGLIKLRTWRECGPFESISTPTYWIRMARKGYINGFYVPPIFVEHMDYPWSKHFIQYGTGVSEILKMRGINSYAELERRYRRTIRNILDGPWEPKYYYGWRAKLKRLKERLSRRLATKNTNLST